MPFTASVISAADWGAIPPKEPCEETIPKYIIIHHTDTPNPPNAISKGTLNGAKQFAKSIQNTHMKTNGWNDSGHNFLNTVSGIVLEGRQGTLTAIVQGKCIRSAHAGNKSANESPGIENEGNFMTNKMSATQWNSLVELCAALCSGCNINPDNIKGHRDFKATKCPGDWLYDQLPRLRQEVRQKLAPPTTPLKKGVKGTKVKDTQLYLQAWSFNPGLIDGIFGSLTETAVMAFQKSRGLAENGIVEEATWNALISSKPTEPPQTEAFTLIDACKIYKGLTEQIEALEWLQGQLSDIAIDLFSKKWRNQSLTNTPGISIPPQPPLIMVNVCKYYRSLEHQNQALQWLQEQISPEIWQDFIQKWRSKAILDLKI
ncbi:MAG TPA: N-acetylmuramoyl-L-alanine amidase [Leptolyngbyaceae cyanobacterium]